MNVLIAEDDRICQLVLKAIINQAGYDVVLADDGASAWELLQDKNAPRLAILDWVMPGMSGIDVLRRVRSKESRGGRRTFIIMLTTKSSPRDIDVAIAAGADAYLPKPYTRDELVAWLRRFEKEITN